MSINSLICSCKGDTFITDDKGYTGTYVFDIYGNRRARIDALMWYMCEIENNIYFSNQSCDNYLYKYDMQTGFCERVAEVACKNLLRYGKYLIFIDEKSSLITAYDTETPRIFSVSATKVESLVMASGKLYYSSKNGIGVYSFADNSEKSLVNAAAENLCVYGENLLFSDFRNNGSLTMLDTKSLQRYTIGNVCADSIAVHGSFVFAANDMEGKAINRINLSKGEILRIYGDAAYSLHVSAEHLYFQTADKTWNRMTVSGDSLTRISF